MYQIGTFGLVTRLEINQQWFNSGPIPTSQNSISSLLTFLHLKPLVVYRLKPATGVTVL
jgi:hypothetical protein